MKSYYKFYFFAILGFYICYMIINHLLEFGLVTYALGTKFANYWMLIPLSLSIFWSCLNLYLGIMKAEIYINEKVEF